MGLAEKRAVASFQESMFPQLTKRVQQAAGFEVPFEVKWETLAVEGYAESYPTFFEKVYFLPLENAFAAITADQMGKDALKAGLKKISLLNEGDIYSPHLAIKFENGVLTINHSPSSNVDNVQDRTEFLQKTLENNL